MRTKGIAEFCAAARRLLAEGVCARFVVAGEFDRDSGKAIPDDEFDGWTSDGVVQYLGMCDDVREVFAQSDVVCLPSWGGEGVPKALIEAASCGLPIVTTDVAGCRDIVQQGVNGLVVPPRTIEPLAAALRTLIDDPQLRREMGARGRQIVINQFSLSIVIEATLAVYRELEREAK
jgi:glycosyltransferase involved in cell wall biosynthesis